MYALLRLILPALAATAATAAFASEITLYEHEAFGGRSVVANQTVPDFTSLGFNDRASSVVIRSGTWQLCSDAYFRGNCVRLGRGQYPNLAAMGLNDAVSSARDLDWNGGGSGPGAPGPGGPGLGGGRPAGRVELFDGLDFQLQAFGVGGPVRNLADVDYNDRAASMIVFEGTWEACTDADFRGLCRVFAPGRYADLMEMRGRISSIRPAQGGTGGAGGGGWGGDGGWGSGSRAILYEQPNLTGRSYTLNSEVVSNLASVGFNDRASSLRIEGGYWIFCTDANFAGECQTFGPGDYPSLPWGLNNRISSGRRIHGQYPYNQGPNWRR